MKLSKYASKFSALLFLCSLFACANDEIKEAPPKIDINTELPYYADATFTPYWIEDGADTLNDFHRISPFSLIDQQGDTITEQSMEGKIYVADFFFTACPGICPKMTGNMAVLQDEFQHEPNVRLLSHSVTPRYDSVPALREYAEAKGVDHNKWHLLTGDRDMIYRLGRKDYFVEEDLGLAKDPDDFLHTENFVLIDRNRHIRGIYNGLNRTSVNQLAADIRTLLGK
jgi:protein SCO1/2